MLACHYATSKLCKDMCHNYWAWHVSPRLHIHRFRPKNKIECCSILEPGHKFYSRHFHHLPRCRYKKIGEECEYICKNEMSV